jgi:protein-tyrosine phosphatase
VPKFKILCLFFILLMGGLKADDDLVLVLDRLEDLSHFRSFADSKDPALKDLAASGSAQFTEAGLLTLKEKFTKMSLMIVDLRRESHGFVDTLPVSWMLWPNNWSNAGWTVEQISDDEEKRLGILRHEKNITVEKVTKERGEMIRTEMAVTVTSAHTESNSAARDGVGYIRVPVADHKAPELEQINQLITLYKTKPPSGWLHFHCKGGKGRTTVFLTMWDMLHNAKKDSFDVILKREAEFSGYNFQEPKNKLYIPEFQKRMKVLQAFYDYCKNNNDAYTTGYIQPTL